MRWTALTVLVFFAAAAVAAEAIPFTAATVSSDKQSFTITWAATGIASVNVYAGKHPGEIDAGKPLGKGGASGKIVVDLPAAPRWYFELVPDRGTPLIVADRALRLATAPNFRDIGGYRTTEGKWLRMGLLYRSDQLNLLSDADLNVLHDIKVRLVCDLRTDAERAGGAMDKLPPGARPLVADVTGSDTNAPLAAALGNPAKLRELGPDKAALAMADVYRQLVTSKTAQAAYRTMFERFADPMMLPGVFHCTAGKDRTGWAAAVFLSIMGVPRDVIMADYLDSNAMLVLKNQRQAAAIPDAAMRAAMEPLMGVRAAYLDAAFDQVSKSFGTMEKYVTEGLGLDVRTLTLLRRLYSAG